MAPEYHSYLSTVMRVSYERLYLVAAAGALSIVAACSPQAGKNGSGNAEESKAPVPSTAIEVAEALKRAKLPVIKIEQLSEVSDDNHLLGRPGQYTSKLFFYDARHPKSAEDDEGENTIEVFSNAVDAKRRHDYIDNIVGGVGMLTQYQILRGPVLVRLDKVVLPSEAKAYENALDAAMR